MSEEYSVREGEPNEDTGLWGYFSTAQWAIYVLLVVGALLFRWISLDVRPMHHDESLHAMYGKYFYDFPNLQFYKYDPMLHGPFLYTMVFLAYTSFGVTDWVARFPAALLGSLFVIAPLLFRRYFSPTALLLLTIGIGFSPSLIYWSRFIREDVFVMFGILLSTYGIAVADRKQAAILFFLGLAIQACSKENWFVHVALMSGFYLFDLGFHLVRGRGQTVPYIYDLWVWGKRYWFYGTVGFGVLVFVFLLFYTAGFQYWDGPLDGLYRKSLSYWFEHHGKERIVGPFLHHGYVLAWYDSIFVLVFFYQLFHLYRRAPSWMSYSASMILTLGVAVALFFLRGKNFGQLEDGLFKSFVTFFKLKDNLDVTAIILMVPHAIFVTLHHLIRGERRLAITGYVFAASLFTYSYLGEKVPWLSQYPLWAGLIYLALYFDHCCDLKAVLRTRVPAERVIFLLGVMLMILGIIFIIQDKDGWSSSSLWTLGIGTSLLCLDLLQSGFSALSAKSDKSSVERLGWSPIPIGLVLVGVTLLYNARMAAIVNFTNAGSEKEYISQVHTTKELKGVVTHIKWEIENQSRGYRPRIYIGGEAVWPVVWYLRDLPENKFGASEDERRQFKYQLIDVDDGEKAPEIFKRRQLNLRGWWVPTFEDMTLKKFLWYAISHQPWSGTGFAYTMLLSRRGEEPGQGS